MADADADAEEAAQLIRRTDIDRDARSSSNTSVSRWRSQDDGANMHGNPFTPPFIANSIRKDALYHYKRLKELESEAPANLDQSSDHDIVRLENPSYGSADAEHLVKLEMVRGMLLGDLLQLLEGAQVLKKKLEDRKEQYTTSKKDLPLAGVLGFIGVGTLLAPLPLQAKVLGAVSVTASAYITGDLFSTRRYDEFVRCTSVVSDGIARLANRVEANQKLDDRDVECLEGGGWDGVPWDEVKG